MRQRKWRAALAVGVFALGISAFGAAPLRADPIDSGSARGFGAQVNLLGQGVIPPSAEASVTAPPFGDDSVEALVPVDLDPVAVNFTANGIARVHEQSDIESELEVSTQPVEGPYNAQGVGSVEDLEVLLEVIEEPVASLIEADLIRSEAVAVCNGGVAEYSGNAEAVNLVIAGNAPLNGPLNDLIAAIDAALDPISDIVGIDVGVVTPLEGGGVTVDALVITVLGVLGDPLAEITLGHSEVGPITCADLDNPGEVVKSGPPTVIAGDSFEYTVTVNNISDRCALENLRVTDVIQGPAGTQVTSTNPTATSVSGQAESGGITVVWEGLGPIQPGQSLALKVTVSTPANAPAGTKFADDALAEYTCNGDPFDDTDRLDAPEIQERLPDTGGMAGPLLLMAGGAGIAAAFGLRGLRRRATTA